jgi:hypothetical protein
MGAQEVLGLAQSFGPVGLIIGYFMWREMRAERIAEKRIDADKALAAAMAVLEAAIRGARK